MNLQRLAVACVAALAASTSASYAGPCSQEIARLQVEIDAKLNARAKAGQMASESTAAKMHRQPTPGSVAGAEVKLGDASPEQAKAVEAAMAEARKADGAGDRSACERALADAQRALGR
jgi:hypothetical protein